MLLWIILTAMTSAAAVWISAPLLRRLDARQAAAARDLEVYRDQLAEIEREQTDGQIDGEQAAAATLEVKRRMLQADASRTTGGRQLSLGERHLALVSATGIVVLGSAILYANSGRPDLPSVAHAPTALVLGNANQEATFQPRGGAIATSQPLQSQGSAGQYPPQAVGQMPMQPATPTGLGSVDDMIQRLIDRLAKDPANVETWRMLGWSYFSTDRFAEAAQAYKKATDLQPRNPALLTAYGEALVHAADGSVTPDALALFDSVLALDAKEPRARFFKGLALEQGRNETAALDGWIALLNEAAPDDAWVADLKARVEQLASRLGVDVSQRLSVVATAPATKQASPTGGILGRLQSGGGPAPAPPKVAATRGPSADDVAAAQALTPAQRDNMIRGMVDGLASRLEKAPRDANGWIQLIRSRKVLGDADAAQAALGKALTTFQDSPAEQNAIATAAAEAGVTR